MDSALREPTIAGPDPNTRTPKLKLPAGACDAHCHIFGPQARYPFDPGRSYTPPDASRDDLKALHAKLGIERAVIVQASCHGPDNSAMLDAIALSGGAYRGVAVVDEGYTDNDFEKLHEGGVRAVRFNFVKHLGGAPDLAFLRRTADIVRGLGWHLVLHFDADDLIDYERLLDDLRMVIVIDHMGRVKAADGLDQRPFRRLLDFLRKESFWVKVCGSERISSAGPPFTDAAPFARALIEAAPDRVLWGTDWPHPNVKVMPNDGDLVDLITHFAPEPDIRQKLLVDNPARLYGFGT